MKFKRSIFATFLLAAAALPSYADAKPKVVTSFTVIADMAREVAGDAATVESITKPAAEIHNYQPTPHDILKSRDADLILWNGLNLELWFARFLQNMGDAPNVTVSEGVEPLSITSGSYEGKPNPHAWMSPSNAVIYVENIRRALIKIDPANEATYSANAKAYVERINVALAPLKAQIESLPEEKRWLVSSEGAFSYLAKDLGLKELYLWPVNADAQGTPQQVRNVIDEMRKNNISVIFSESTVSPEPAKQVANETGAHYGGVLYVDSLSESDGEVPTYLDLLKVTTNVVVEGLKK
jgi:manganese/iron transport system substrate-binding protein